MKVSEFIGVLFLDIIKAIIVSLIFYIITNSIDATYYFALGAAIGFIVWDTIKTITLVKTQKVEADNNEGEEQ